MRCGASAVSSPLLLAVALASFTAAFTLFAWFEATTERNFSVTGVVAAILTFMLGAYAVLGHPLVAVAAAVAMAVLLALKEPLHSWVRALIAGVSFVGYIAIRIMGDQTGIVVASIAGGVTSSTATTLSFARLARDHPEASSLLGGGILIAGVTMVIRVVAIAAALAPSLLAELLLPGLAAAAVMAAAGGLLVFGQNNSEAGRSVLRLKNPFELASALKLASLIAIIMLLAKLVSAKIGAQGVFLLAAASGIADVDALTLSMARLAGAQITMSAVMAGSIGGRKLV